MLVAGVLEVIPSTPSKEKGSTGHQVRVMWPLPLSVIWDFTATLKCHPILLLSSVPAPSVMWLLKVSSYYVDYFFMGLLGVYAAHGDYYTPIGAMHGMMYLLGHGMWRFVLVSM